MKPFISGVTLFILAIASSPVGLSAQGAAPAPVQGGAAGRGPGEVVPAGPAAAAAVSRRS